MALFISVEVENRRTAKVLSLEKPSHGNRHLTTIEPRQRRALVKIFLERDKKRRLIHEFDIPNLPPEPPRPDLYLDAAYDGRYSLDLRVRIEDRLFAQKQIDLRPYLRKPGKILAGVFAALASAAAVLLLLLWGFGIIGGQVRGGIAGATEEEVAEDKTTEQAEEETEAVERDQATREDDREPDTEAESRQELAARKNGETDEAGGDGTGEARAEEGPAVVEEESASREESSEDTGAEADLDRRIEIVYFRPDGVELTAEAKRKLDNIAEFLSTHPQAELSLRGHTALFGTEKGRAYISDERAENTFTYLRSLGWKPEDDVLVEGLGGSEPVTMDPKRQELNRRVEILITY